MVALPSCLVTGVLVIFNWFPDPMRQPEPKLLFSQRQELPDADASAAISGAAAVFS